MKYTNIDFGNDLIEELNKGYDVVRLSRWAMSIYLKWCQEADTELDKTIMSIVAMEEGPAFEFSEQEIRLLAKKLQSSQSEI
jgi:hypothetical protein